MSDRAYKFQLKLFIIFTIFLLLEGFFYYYSYKLSYFSENAFFDINRSGFNPLIWNESKLVETIQIIILLLTIYHLIKNIILKNKNKFSKFFLYLLWSYTLCIAYFFLEEISWGQHFFKWETNEILMILNNQGETNIHNISNFFDQVPRSILTLWCGFSMLLVKFFKFFSSKELYVKFVFPSKKIRNISFILILFLIPDLLVDKLNLHPGYNNYTQSVNLAEIYDFITFNFIRLSEFQELIFAFYLYHHVLFFREYLR